jgi:hypothetical protein
MYPTQADAEANTNRKGWLGYDNGNILQINDGGSGGVDLVSKAAIRLYGYGTSRHPVVVTEDMFRNNANDARYLGGTNYKWKSVFAVNGTIQTSDRNQKKNIEPIDEKYIQLFDKLQPVTFELKSEDENSHDRVHIGFISQDVKTAMDEVGLDPMDFAGYCRDEKTELVTDPDTNEEIERPVTDENGDPVYLYSLRYSEFIALNTRMIQENRKKIADQQTEIDILKAQVEELKTAIADLSKARG